MTVTDSITTDRTTRIRAAERFAYAMRHHVLDMGEAQGQGYVGQALGAADMFAAVYSGRLRYRPADPHWAERDRFLLSTGHYAIGLYAALAEAGTVSVSELETYGSDDSRLPMSGMASYTPGWRSAGARWDTDCRWRWEWLWDCVTRGRRHSCSTSCRTGNWTRAPRGRPRWEPLITDWATSSHSST